MRTYLQAVAGRIIETDGCVAHDWLVGVAKHLLALDASSALRGDAAHLQALYDAQEQITRERNEAWAEIERLVAAVDAAEVRGDALRAVIADMRSEIEHAEYLNYSDRESAIGVNTIGKWADQLSALLGDTRSVITEEEHEQKNDARVVSRS